MLRMYVCTVVGGRHADRDRDVQSHYIPFLPMSHPHTSSSPAKQFPTIIQRSLQMLYAMCCTKSPQAFFC